MICTFFLFLLVALIKRERKYPRKRKIKRTIRICRNFEARTEKHFVVVLTSKFYNSMPKIQSLSGSLSFFKRYKKGTFINFLKFVPQTVTLGGGIV